MWYMKVKNKNNMKNLITLLVLLISTTTFGQVLQPTGTMYDGEIVFSQEPELVDSLLQVYNIDTTGLEIIGYHSNWDSLRNNFKQTIVVYSLDKVSNNGKSYTVIENVNETELKKYMVITLFDEKDKKFLNLRLF